MVEKYINSLEWKYCTMHAVILPNWPALSVSVKIAGDNY